LPSALKWRQNGEKICQVWQHWMTDTFFTLKTFLAEYYDCDYRSFGSNLLVNQDGPALTDVDVSLSALGTLNGKPWLLGGGVVSTVVELIL
jgi:hypothetical protein